MQIFTFASKSGGKPHTTKLHNDGHVTCSCQGFKSPNRCWHYADVLAKSGGQTGSLFGDDASGAADGSIPAGTPATLTLAPTGLAAAPAALPKGFIEPMLACALPEGFTVAANYKPSDHILERKFDGHRLIIEKCEGESYRAWSRAGNARILPAHIAAIINEYLPACTVDCELYIYGDGMTSTDVTAEDKQHLARLAIFDILKVEVAGTMHSAMAKPLWERRQHLEYATSKLPADQDHVHISAQYASTDAELQRMWALGFEGAIVKYKRGLYEAGRRSKAWVKFKKGSVGRAEIIRFEEGKLGPHSRIVGKDADGIEMKCKTLNDEWRAMFAVRSAEFIGKTIVFNYIEKTRDGKYKSAMADHIE